MPILPIPKDVYKLEILNHITSSCFILVQLAKKQFVLSKEAIKNISLKCIGFITMSLEILFQDLA